MQGAELQRLVNLWVKPEVQEHYQKLVDPPLDHVRMAWPFKTEEELKILSRWHREQAKLTKQKTIDDHKQQYGEAFL